MYQSMRSSLVALILTVALLPFPAQADLVRLTATMSVANLNGSDPALVTDPLGVVPTDASGSIQIALNTDNNTFDFELEVTSIERSELREFGPNHTWGVYSDKP